MSRSAVKDHGVVEWFSKNIDEQMVELESHKDVEGFPRNISERVTVPESPRDVERLQASASVRETGHEGSLVPSSGLFTGKARAWVQFGKALLDGLRSAGSTSTPPHRAVLPLGFQSLLSRVVEDSESTVERNPHHFSIHSYTVAKKHRMRGKCVDRGARRG